MKQLDPAYDVIAYTDGGCRGNPGPGAWGYVLINPRTLTAQEAADGDKPTTNNRMELQAVLEALKALSKPGLKVLIRSDSKYTIDCCSSWMAGWKKRGWTRKGGELKNVDILKELDQALSKHQVQFEWVKGHAGERGNEHVDGLLNDAMDRLAAGTAAAHKQRFTWK